MLTKTYSKEGNVCMVTFELPASHAAQTACLCGEFNNWNEASHPLELQESGRLTLTLALQSGNTYRFRYLLDGHRWENDEGADAYVPNPFGSDDSVIEV